MRPGKPQYLPFNLILELQMNVLNILGVVCCLLADLLS